MLTNNSSFACPVGYMEPGASRVLRTGMVTLIMMASVLCNTAVARVMWRHRGRLPLTYSLVLNLVITELLLTLSYPVLFYAQWYSSWPLGGVMCRLLSTVPVCCTAVLTYSLAELALYRCLTLVKPNLVRALSSRAARTTVILSWLWGVILAIPAAMASVVSPESICEPALCVLGMDSTARQGYTFALLFLSYIAPSAIVITAYATAACHTTPQELCDEPTSPQARGEEEELNRADQAVPLPSPKRNVNRTIGHLPPAPLDVVVTKRRKRNIIWCPVSEWELELMQVVLTLVFVYILCCLAYVVVMVVEAQEVPWYQAWPYRRVATMYAWLLQCLPSALHPIVVYWTMCKTSNQRTKDILMCTFTY
ncbi:RYamide receptor [Nematostella vectensis]|uniref:RYamide receptor n=1 Tax=Nematostella vectensis TaxID=45351 RepID=UPI001390684A|nr:RYamide receptor [Nematostella vectensis]